MKKINLLDCISRDADTTTIEFSKLLINNYLSAIAETKIDYVEIGFRFKK